MDNSNRKEEFTHAPECPVRKSGNKRHSVQGFAPLLNPAREDAMDVSLELHGLMIIPLSTNREALSFAKDRSYNTNWLSDETGGRELL